MFGQAQRGNALEIEALRAEAEHVERTSLTEQDHDPDVTSRQLAGLDLICEFAQRGHHVEISRAR